MAKTLAAPPPKYASVAISDEVPWHTKQHLQLLYQKQGELVQAITILQAKLDALSKGSGS